MFSGKEKSKIRGREVFYPSKTPEHQSSPNEVETTYISSSPKSPRLLLLPWIFMVEEERKTWSLFACSPVLSDQMLPLLRGGKGGGDESADTRSRLNPMTQSQKYSEAFGRRIQTQAQSGWTTGLICSPRPFSDQSKQWRMFEFCLNTMCL